MSGLTIPIHVTGDDRIQAAAGQMEKLLTQTNANVKAFVSLAEASEKMAQETKDAVAAMGNQVGVYSKAEKSSLSLLRSIQNMTNAVRQFDAKLNDSLVNLKAFDNANKAAGAAFLKQQKAATDAAAALGVYNRQTQLATATDKARLKGMQDLDNAMAQSALLSEKRYAWERKQTLIKRELIAEFDRTATAATKEAVALRELQRIGGSSLAPLIANQREVNKGLEQGAAFAQRQNNALAELGRTFRSDMTGQIAQMREMNKGREQDVTFIQRQANALAELRRIGASSAAIDIAKLKEEIRGREQAATFILRQANALAQLRDTLASGKTDDIVKLKEEIRGREQAATFTLRQANALKELERVATSGDTKKIAQQRERNKGIEQEATLLVRLTNKLHELNTLAKGRSAAGIAQGSPAAVQNAIWVAEAQAAGNKKLAATMVELENRERQLKLMMDPLVAARVKAVAIMEVEQKTAENLATAEARLAGRQQEAAEMLRLLGTEKGKQTILDEQAVAHQKRLITIQQEEINKLELLRERTAALSSAQRQEKADLETKEQLERRQAQLLARSSAAMKALIADIKRLEAAEQSAGHSTIGLTLHLNIMNQAMAATRATLYGLGTSFGMYTSSTLLVATAMFALSSAFRAALTSAVEYEAAIKHVAAMASGGGFRTPEYAADLKALNDQAMGIATSTRYGATEVSNAMNQLALAGLKVDEILVAAKPVLRLAAVGMLDVAQATDIATNTMMGFGLHVRDLPRVVDILAKAATDSNSNVQELGTAMSYAAPLAKSFGVDLETTAAAMEVLANAGIKGSRAGTGFRRVLIEIFTPGKRAQEMFAFAGIEVNKVAEGMENLEALTDPVAGVLKQTEMGTGRLTSTLKGLYLATAGATQNLKILGDAFGVYGLPAVTHLIASLGHGSKSLTSFADSLRNVEGYSAEVSAKMYDSLENSWAMLKSLGDALGIAIESRYAKALTEATDAVGIWLRQLYDSPEAIDLIIAKFTTFGSSVWSVIKLLLELKAAMMVFGLMAGAVTVVNRLATAFVGLGSAASGAAIATRVSTMLVPWIAVATAIGGAIALAVSYFGSVTKAADATASAAASWIADVTGIASSAQAVEERMNAARKQSYEEVKTLLNGGLDTLYKQRDANQRLLMQQGLAVERIRELNKELEGTNNQIALAEDKLRRFSNLQGFTMMNQLDASMSAVDAQQAAAAKAKTDAEQEIRKREDAAQRSKGIAVSGLGSMGATLAADQALATAKQTAADARIEYARLDAEKAALQAQRDDIARMMALTNSDAKARGDSVASEVEKLEKSIGNATARAKEFKRQMDDMGPAGKSTPAFMALNDALKAAVAEQDVLGDKLREFKSQAAMERSTVNSFDEISKAYQDLKKRENEYVHNLSLTEEQRADAAVQRLTAAVATAKKLRDDAYAAYEVAEAAVSSDPSNPFKKEKQGAMYAAALGASKAYLDALDELDKASGKAEKASGKAEKAHKKVGGAARDQSSDYERLIKKAYGLAKAESELADVQRKNAQGYFDLNQKLRERSDIYDEVIAKSKVLAGTLSYERIRATDLPATAGVRGMPTGYGGNYVGSTYNRGDSRAVGTGQLQFQNSREAAINPVLKQMLELTGRTLKITEGFAGGGHVKNSMHYSGNAVDISMAGMSAAERQALAEDLLKAGVKRLGTYGGKNSNMLHADLGNVGGNGGNWFMYDYTNKNMGRAPAWFQQVAAARSGAASTAAGQVSAAGYDPDTPKGRQLAIAEETNEMARLTSSVKTLADQRRVEATAVIEQFNAHQKLVEIKARESVLESDLNAAVSVVMGFEQMKRSGVELDIIDQKAYTDALSSASATLDQLNTVRAAGIALEIEEIRAGRQIAITYAQTKDDLDRLASSYGAASIAEKDYRQAGAELKLLLDQKVISVYEYKKALENQDTALAQARGAWAAYYDELEVKTADWEQMGIGAMQAFEDAIASSIQNGKLSFDDFFSYIAAAAAKFAAQQAVLAAIKAIQALAGADAKGGIDEGGAGWLGKLLLSVGMAYATGGSSAAVTAGASSAGGLLGSQTAGGEFWAMAKGGAVSAALAHGAYTSPTYFPMSTSGVHAYARGTGLLGEAGPEMVLPAQRMAGGKLGVSAAGMAPKLNIIVNNAPGHTADVKQDSNGGLTIDIIKNVARETIAKDISSGNSMVANSAQSAWGLRRVGR